MERPKQMARDRGAPVWVSFLLGTAGIAVTAAGGYELLRQHPSPPPNPAPALKSTYQTAAVAPAREASSEELSEREAARLRKIEHLRRTRHEALLLLDLRRDGYRCIDGHLFRKQNGAWENTGLCPK